MPTILDKSGIKRVTFYTASPVECCSRCSAGIKYVALVEYRDGVTEKYGSECINKILSAAPDMRKLFSKNEKLLKRYTDALEIFSRKPEDMPRGREYYGSGLYFVADSTGKDISTTHWFFHPLPDVERNAQSGRYPIGDVRRYTEKQLAAIKEGKAWLQKEVTRIEVFLARILNKVQLEAFRKTTEVK